jgi:hypothetical protein
MALMAWPIIRNPIRAFAVACVAATSAYVMWMGYRLNEVLAGPSWCSTAIGADRATENSKIDVATSCVGLLTIQLKSIAMNSHILFGVVALCLLVLIVIVIAGAKLDIHASKEGEFGVNMSRDEPVVASETVKAAAKGAAEGAVGAAAQAEPTAPIPPIVPPAT